MAQTQQEKFNELIQRLINDSSGNPEITSDNFSGIVFNELNEEEQDNFWKYLIEFLKNENDFLQHYAIRENDIGENSLVNFIQEYSDLDDGTLIELMKKYYSNDKLDNNFEDSDTGVLDQNQYFWNESVSKIISYCLQHIFPNGISDLEGEEPTDKEIKDGNTRGSISMGETDSKKVSFRVKNIVNGNAGNSFDKDGRWVQPWFNIDLDTYKEVRDIDPIPNVLNKSKELQFTRKPYYYINDGDKNIEEKIENWAKKAIAANLNNIEITDDEYQEILEKKKQWFKENYIIYRDQLINNQVKREDIEDASGILVNTILSIDEYISESKSFEKWLRLIMPKYQRRVEVEDLDRNFWVIGQILSGISSYLFGDEQPIIKAFKNLLNEIIQLWQNVFFLWFTAAAISQRKKYMDVQTIFIPIMNNEIQQHIKFDNFDKTKTINLEECWERLKYLKDQYNESNLIVIPEVRCNNYKHDYYSKVYYPGVIMYDRNLNEVKCINFQVGQVSVDKTIYFWPDMNGNGKIDANLDEDNADSDAHIIEYLHSIKAVSFDKNKLELLFKEGKNMDDENDRRFKNWPKYINHNPYKIDLDEENYSFVEQWLALAGFYLDEYQEGEQQKVRLGNYFDEILSKVSSLDFAYYVLKFTEEEQNTNEYNWQKFLKNQLLQSGSDEESVNEILEKLKREYSLKFNISEPYIDLSNYNELYSQELSGFLKEDNKYYILNNFYNLLDKDTNFRTNKEGYYYGAIRTVPKISAKYDGELKIENIDLSFYDVAKELFNQNGLLGSWKYQQIFNFSDSSDSIVLDRSIKDNFATLSTESINISKGYYLGECVSYLAFAKEQFVWSGKVQNISLYPENYYIAEKGMQPGTAGDLERYLTTDPDFIEKWHQKCRERWNQIENKGKNYIEIFMLHSGLNYSISSPVSGFEINPLLSIYLLKNGKEYIYDFKIVLDNYDTINEPLGKFNCPIVSSIADGDNDFGDSYKSTNKLGMLKSGTYEIDGKLNNQAFEKVGAQFYYRENGVVEILAPSSNKRVGAPVGNMATATYTLDIKEEYKNSKDIIKLSDFYIYIYDRAYIFSKQDETGKVITESIENAIPYYYNCKFPNNVEQGKLNSIKATLFFNKTKTANISYTPILNDSDSLCNISQGLSKPYKDTDSGESKKAELIPNSSNMKKAFISFLGNKLNDEKRTWLEIYF